MHVSLYYYEYGMHIYASTAILGLKPVFSTTTLTNMWRLHITLAIWMRIKICIRCVLHAHSLQSRPTVQTAGQPTWETRDRNRKRRSNTSEWQDQYEREDSDSGSSSHTFLLPFFLFLFWSIGCKLVWWFMRKTKEWVGIILRLDRGRLWSASYWDWMRKIVICIILRLDEEDCDLSPYYPMIHPTVP